MSVATRVQLQPAYVLHGRPFQESSLLLAQEFLYIPNIDVLF